MNVYVESGFVLTLALQQDDYQAAERLVQLAARGRCSLKMPVFCISEPFATVQYRANNRNRLIEELRKEARELGRTRLYQGTAGELMQHVVDLAEVLKTQLIAVEAVVRELSQRCEILQLDAIVLGRASSLRAELNLKQQQDAIILASIILDLERAPSTEDALFISQNVRDFEQSSVQNALQRLACKYLADFTNAVRYIERPTGSG